MSNKPPAILLYFANNQDSYLEALSSERDNVYQVLYPIKSQRIVDVEKVENATLEKVRDWTRQLEEQLTIVHYAGHANSTMLHFEDQEGRLSGIAQLLGRLPKLQLVFLNGCATAGRVEELLGQGIKVVIATSRAINDVLALRFAEAFYGSIAKHQSIRDAFDYAVATVHIEKDKKIVKQKGLKLKKKNDEEAFPWGLYYADEADLNWKLPIQHTYDYSRIIVAPEYRGQPVNILFIKFLKDFLAEYNFILQNELGKPSQSIELSVIKREIVDSFPLPIGENLRKLFTKENKITPSPLETHSTARLQQLKYTYMMTMRFLGNVLLLQVWESVLSIQKTRSNHCLDRTIQDWIDNYFHLSKTNFMAFDYYTWCIKLYEYLQKTRIEYSNFLIEGLVNIHLKSVIFSEANQFFKSLEHGAKNGVEPQEIIEKCLQAEIELAQVLNTLICLVKYDLVSIKDIKVEKRKFDIAKYWHEKIKLDKAMTAQVTGFSTTKLEAIHPIESQSVLFYQKSSSNAFTFCSLTPFLLDKYAQDQSISTKSSLYIYAYSEDDKYYFENIQKPNDPFLEINQQAHYPFFYALLTKCKHDLLDGRPGHLQNRIEPDLPINPVKGDEASQKDFLFG